MRERLTPYGLFHEIISWKLAMFVPADASGPMVLAKVIERFPVQRISEWLGPLMPSRDASELAHRLAQWAEAVCRHYLSNGRRVGYYWLVGDVSNTPGRSMFVRLKGPDSGKGAAGERTDAATGEHGDLLDVIRESLCLVDFKDVSEEARSFLSMPQAIAAVTDLKGKLAGAHRTWLDPGGFSGAHLGRAPIDTPRLAMGELLGHGVRFGCCSDVMAAGEGIETMLSQRTVLPAMPAHATLSAAHLYAILFPDTLRRLYVARDNDPAATQLWQLSLNAPARPVSRRWS